MLKNCDHDCQRNIRLLQYTLLKELTNKTLYHPLLGFYIYLYTYGKSLTLYRVSHLQQIKNVPQNLATLY